MFTFCSLNKYLLNTLLCATQNMKCGKYKSEQKKKKKDMVPPFTKCLMVVVTVKHLGDKRGFTHFFMSEFQVKTFWLENTLSEAFQAFTNIMLIFTHPFLLQLHRWEELWGSQLDPQNKTKTLLFIIIFNFISFYKIVLPSMISHFLYQSSHQITLGYFQKSNLSRNGFKKKLSLLRICKRIC